jgi:hypothetical protein
VRVSLQLSYDKVAAARACGIEFPPATPAQVQRLSMQRKVFEIDGQPHLATRDGGFFETAGTLERPIAGELEARQQADLAAWDAGGTAEPSSPTPAQAAPEPAKPCLFWLSPPCEFVLLSSYFYYS